MQQARSPLRGCNDADSASWPILHTLQEALKGLGNRLWTLEHHEVVTIHNGDLALRDYAVMLARRFDGNHRIGQSMDDEHGSPVARHDGPQRALIGIIEVPRIFDVE